MAGDGPLASQFRPALSKKKKASSNLEIQISLRFRLCKKKKIYKNLQKHPTVKLGLVTKLEFAGFSCCIIKKIKYNIIILLYIINITIC